MPRGIHINHDLDYYIKIYQECGTLTDAAQKLGIHLETLRQVFIKNNIIYTKQLVYEVDHAAFDLLTPASMYWAGFIAADGNIEKNKNRLKIELATDDEQHLEKFKKFVKTNAPITNCIKYDNRIAFKSKIYYSSLIRFTSTTIINNLRDNFNIGPTKSLTYTFPNHLSEHHYLHHFIRGLIDGDGWIYDNTSKNRKTIGLSGNAGLVLYVLNFLCDKLLLTYNGRYSINKNTAKFNFNRLSDLKKIITYLYQDCDELYLERKYLAAQNILQLTERKINIDYNILKEAYDRLTTHTAMAKELKCSNSTIKRRMIEVGLY